jgi:DNA-binding NarL/FixJ family response regulator
VATAATTVADTVVESVGTLIESSLLVRVPAADPEAGQRFRQLESIRLYGLDRLTDAGETRREEEVAVLVAKGLTNRQIATRLGMGERTVESHLEHIRRKLALESRVQVALWAAHQG